MLFNFIGLIIIDMEHWGATWNQNFNDMEIYKIESRLKTKKAFPTLSESEIEAKVCKYLNSLTVKVLYLFLIVERICHRRLSSRINI